MTWLSAIGNFFSSSGGQSVLSGISSLFGGRSQRKGDKESAQRGFQALQYMNQMDRRNQLEDRRYKEESIGAYRQFAPENLQGNSPAYTDPSTVQVVDPYAPKPKPQRKMLGG